MHGRSLRENGGFESEKGKVTGRSLKSLVEGTGGIAGNESSAGRDDCPNAIVLQRYLRAAFKSMKNRWKLRA